MRYSILKSVNIAAALFLIFSAILHPMELSLEECLEISEKSSRDLKTAQNRADTARASLLNSTGSLLPRIGAGASYDVKDGSAMSYSVSASQVLFSGFSLINSLNAASENLKAAEADLSAAKSRAAYDAKAGFIRLYKSKEALKLSEDIHGRRKIQSDIVRVKFDAGREHKGSYLTSMAQLMESEAEIKSARRALELSGMRLASAIGLEGFPVITPKGAFEVKKTSAVEPDFIALAAKVPSVIRSQASLKSAEHEFNSSLGSFLPSVSLSGGYSRSGSEFIFENESWRLGLSISLPVFEGFSNVVRSSNSLRSFSNAETTAVQALNDAVLGLKEKWNVLKAAEDSYETASSFLEAAETRAQIAQAQYSAGLLNYDSWIIIENDLVRYKKSFLDAAAALYLAEADWELQKGEY